jgi:hypothetical protein
MITIEPITWETILWGFCILITISVLFYIIIRTFVYLALKELESKLNKKSNNLKKENHECT